MILEHSTLIRVCYALHIQLYGTTSSCTVESIFVQWQDYYNSNLLWLHMQLYG